jgi:hypothetical protein
MSIMPWFFEPLLPRSFRLVQIDPPWEFLSGLRIPGRLDNLPVALIISAFSNGVASAGGSHALVEEV